MRFKKHFVEQAAASVANVVEARLMVVMIQAPPVASNQNADKHR